MNFSLGRNNFYQEIQQPEEQIDLAKAALYIAQEENPNLDPQEYLNALDTMAQEVRERLPEQRYPLRVIKTINQYLYQDLGFQGNTKNYYDPSNSFLDQVIERRTGIPITLSLVYLEIAKRVDLPMVGIGMPGHFLIRPDFEAAGIFVNAFNSGEILFEQDCEALLSKIYQRSVKLQPRFLDSVGAKQFLARMLTNLKLIYLNQAQLRQALGAVERIILLFPQAVGELRDRGLIYYELGQWEQATQDLEFYLATFPHAQDAAVIRQVLQAMGQS